MADTDSKACIKCGQHLPLTEFHRTPNNRDGRCGSCKACRNAYQRAWEASLTPERREARLERHRQASRKYDEANRDKTREYVRKNTARATERHRKWRQENRERFREILNVSRYRRRARCADGMNSRETRNWFERQKLVCHWCGAGCPDNATIDHIMPLARGGKHEKRNLCIACKTCNSRKHAKHPITFAQENGKLL